MLSTLFLWIYISMPQNHIAIGNEGEERSHPGVDSKTGGQGVSRNDPGAALWPLGEHRVWTRRQRGVEGLEGPQEKGNWH